MRSMGEKIKVSPNTGERLSILRQPPPKPVPTPPKVVDPASVDQRKRMIGLLAVLEKRKETPELILRMAHIKAKLQRMS